MNENDLIASAMMSLIGEELITNKIKGIDDKIAQLIDDIFKENQTENLIGLKDE